MEKKRYLTAEEAAAELGITRATLYAYVSRGLIRSEPADARRRTHRYRAEDVQRLKQRKEQRRDPRLAAEAALHFGAPVLESAITLIADGHLYYRGHDIRELAGVRSVESVASFLWSGEWKPELFDDVAHCSLPQEIPRPAGADGLSAVERFQLLLPLMAAGDYAAFDLRPPQVMATGARIVKTLALSAADRERTEGDIVGTLQEGWGAGGAEVRRLLSAALTVSADHELNVSSFTARCVASAASTPYQVVQAGLAALQGQRHGGHTARVSALLKEVGTPAEARAALGERLRRGDALPGFGHPLYPQGDPRAALLLEMAGEVSRNPAAHALALAVIEAAEDLVGERPNIDFALVTTARALDLPRGSALTLFALGRSVGWIAHAIEQYESGQLIRPRARYRGPLPSQA